MESLYKTVQGKKEILNLYEQKLESLQIQYDYTCVNTSFGATNIIVTGDSSNPPLLLIHGSNGCAPVALEAYPNLCKSYKVYAIDVLAQPNKSAETKMSMKDDSYGKWMYEIIEALNISNVTMAGFSFGGLVILKTLEFSERTIKEVFLAAPAYIVNGNPLKALFKVFIPMKRYMSTKKLQYVEKVVAALFTEKDQFAVKYLSKVFESFRMDFSPVPVIKTKKAKNIETPITIFAAENDLLFPGNKMKKRAIKIFPSLKKIMVLENSKHVQGIIHNRIIEKDILQN
ncbi:alpha/beta fold hydrolase [Kordia sp.]|uniref:alpha/beta fold hydrolase n=1 Tax=Kordia sp. TaxID=1965332 RepID=UPI003B592F2B